VPETAFAAVVTTYQRTNDRLRQQVTDYVRDVWLSLGNYHDEDIERFIAQVLPVVEAGQHQAAVLTDGYLSLLDAAVTGTASKPLGIPPGAMTTEALRGVPGDEVYRRPATTLYRALSAGHSFPDAVSQGLNRATSLAETGQQLARTHTSQRVLSTKTAVAGYRRSLTGGRSCALCIVAATQRYHRAELMPIHPGCDCGITTIYRDHDPGHVIDPDQLSDVHALIAERFGTSDPGARAIDYRGILVQHEHGEIGPILGVRGQDFTGPTDL
jgi:hypothetical protein